MNQPCPPARPGVPELILAVRRGARAEFGERYGQLLDDPDVEAITRSTLAVLDRQVRRWIEDSTDAPAAIEAIHRQVSASYPRCCAIFEVNLVVLEHLARSVVGLSSLLSTLDASLGLLYASLLIGADPNTAEVDSAFLLHEPAGRLDG
ncbi:MAG: hypothetical protein ACR2N4_05255 [Jatrophihabitans sp.]